MDHEEFMAFWHKKGTDIEDMTTKERLKRIEVRLNMLEADTLGLATAQETIRNKVLRKIQHKKEPKDEEKPKDIYSGGLIPV